MDERRIDELRAKTSLTLEECQELMDCNDGDLEVVGWDRLHELPDNLTVPGDLNVGHSGLIKFPKNLNVGGTLRAHNTFITSVPSDMCVGGDIFLNSSSLRHLPDNFIVNGSLIISDTQISELPHGLNIKCNLIACNTYIRHLPDDINVGRDINLYRTPLEDFPANMKVEGSLDLSKTCITKLPDGLTVNAYLDISNNPQLTELPNNMSVRFGLHARMCGIKSLPTNIRDVGSLELPYNPIDTLPDDMSFNGGDLNIQHTNITNLPNGLRVNSTLNASRSALISLPDDIMVGDAIYIECTNISELPENLIVPFDLDISNTNISVLPKNLIVGGTLFVSPNQIDDIPTGAKIGRISCVSKHKSRYSVLSSDSKPIYRFTDGEYVEGKYLYADGMLTSVKSKKTCGKYTIYYGAVDGRNVVYDGKHYAHCSDIRRGIRDIEHKYEKDKKLDEYKELSLDSVVSKDYAIEMYRNITGACEQGTQLFVNSLGDTIKDEYTIDEIIRMTACEYGNEKFTEFFTSNSK